MFHVKRTPPAACRTGRDAPAVAPIKKSLGRSGRGGSPAPTPPPVRSLPLAAYQVEQHPRQLLLPKTPLAASPTKNSPRPHPSKPPVETGGSATEPGSRAGQLNPAHTGPRPCCQQPTHAGSPAPALPPVRSLPLAACQVEQTPPAVARAKIPPGRQPPPTIPPGSQPHQKPSPDPPQQAPDGNRGINRSTRCHSPHARLWHRWPPDSRWWFHVKQARQRDCANLGGFT